MLRILLLLLGTRAARKTWPLLGMLGITLIATGIVLAVDGLHGIVLFNLRFLGFAIVALAATMSIGIVTSRGTKRRLYVARAAALFLFGIFILLRHIVDDIVLAMLFGIAYLVDGIFRVAAASVVRFTRWGWALALGVAELGFSAFIFEPYPTHYAGTVPVCLGMTALLVGVTCLHLAARLQRVKEGHSLPLLFSRCCPEDIVVAAANGPSSTTGPVMVHVWTPTGALNSTERRILVDRYVAAVDSRGVISTGHAALAVGDKTYISHYPAKEIDRSPDAFAETLRASKDNDVEARFLPSYASEAADWCPSTMQVAFTDADVGRVEQFWKDYASRNVYNLTRRNCSTTTVLALEVALEGILSRRKLGPLGVLRTLFSPELVAAAMLRRRAEAAAWTPGLALDYIRAISGICAATQKTFKESVSDATAVAQSTQQREKEERESLLPGDEGLLATEEASTIPAGARRLSLVAIVATAAIFGMTYGLAAPLISGELERAGHTSFIIGINAAMHAIGVLAVAPFLPRLSVRFGAKRLVASALLISAVALTLFRVIDNTWAWFPLRFLLGTAAEVLLVMSETWANQLSDAKSRGKVMALYTGAVSLGFAVGPAFLSFVGTSRNAFLFGAVAAFVAVFPIILPQVIPPKNEEKTAHSTRHYLQLAPLAMGTALLNAAVETAGLSFIPSYAMAQGFSETMALRLVATLLVGAIVLQFPMGALADRFPARPLMVVLAGLSALGVLAWPLLLPHPIVAFAAMFLWGGVFVGIYTVMLTSVGRRFQGSELVGVYAVMSVCWGVGALVGPALAGVAVEGSERWGLPGLVAAACLGFAAFVWGGSDGNAPTLRSTT